MAKFAPYGLSSSLSGKPRKLLSDDELREIYGPRLPGWSLEHMKRDRLFQPFAEFTTDFYDHYNPWSAPLWQEGAFTNVSPPSQSASISPSLKDLVASEFSPRPSTSSDVAALHWSPTTTNAAAINEILPQPPERPLPPLQQTRFPRFPSAPFMRYQDSTQDMLGGTGMHPSHGLLGKAETQIYPEVSGEQTSTFPLPPEAPRLLGREGPGYWTNPDTDQVMDIESELGPQYHSTIPMGYAPHDPNRQTGFFSNLGRRLMSGVTAPYRHFTDISDVPATGSGIGAAASTFGPLLASAAIPGGGLFSLLSRLLPDSGPTPYQQEGRNVSDISFGPKTAWLGADVPGGGYYIPNQKIDMAQLGGGRTPGGRGITVHTPEGLVDATYRVDPTGAASITSKGFGAPGVDYGDIYYGGADYEGLDTGQFDDIFSGEEDWF